MREPPSALSLQDALAPSGQAGGLLPLIRPLTSGQTSGGDGALVGVIDPATGRAVATLACATAEEIDAAVESASMAAAMWRSTSFEERAARLHRVAELIRDEADEIAGLIAREQGKPRHEALALEILPALDHLKFMIANAQRYHMGIDLEPRHPLYAHKRALYLYDPLGVVALITSSSLPFAVPLIQTAAALAMGNAVVLKPSEHAPRSGLRVGELCLAAGLPEGVVNVVPALPEETLRLVAHPKVDKVFFTGSLDAGQQVMATASQAPRPVVLALGGKHPAVVAGDADIERAAQGIAWGAFANGGQNCGAVERVFVEERIAKAFLERLLAAVDRIKIGHPLEEGTELGPLATEWRRLSVHRQVLEATTRGARLLRGGLLPEGPGFFYPPTVLLAPPLDARVMREETLGPVLPVVVVESLERAILLANDSSYALTASGWTGSAQCAERLLVGLQAGVVTINDLLYAFGEPAATWSGYRKSGIGHNHGTPGLREMCRQRFVSFDELPAEAPLFAYPYDEQAGRMLQAALDQLHGDGRVRRWRGLARLALSPRFRARMPLRSFLFRGRRRA